MTTEGYNVPPWRYEPVGPFMWSMYEGGHMLSTGEDSNLDEVCALLAKRFLPPRLDQTLALIDGENQLLIGWHTLPSRAVDFLGVQAAFAALAPHLPDHQFELSCWELNAQGVMW